MFVKPAPDRAVRDPMSRLLLPADGALVPDTQFWQRRVLFGDVVETEPPAAAQVPAEAAPAPANAEAEPGQAEAAAHEAPAEVPDAEQGAAR